MNKQESVGIRQTGHNTPGLTEVLHGEDAQEPDHHLGLDSLLTPAAGQEDLVQESDSLCSVECGGYLITT